MQEWWSYRPGDFLLFSPRTYWRLFQLANEALWPLQIPVLLIGAAILAMLFRPRAWADRVIPAVLAAAWLCVSVGFLWMHYAAINWRSISCPSSWARRYLCSGSGPCAAGSPSLLSVACRG